MFNILQFKGKQTHYINFIPTHSYIQNLYRRTVDCIETDVHQ